MTRDYRLCASCQERAYWVDDTWTCDRCGAEWSADHGTEYDDPDTLTPGAIYRVARKEWECIAARLLVFAGPPQPDCTRVIRPGEPYIEYTGEVPGYQSGYRYCLPCGMATWGKDKGQPA